MIISEGKILINYQFYILVYMAINLTQQRFDGSLGLENAPFNAISPMLCTAQMTNDLR